MLDEIIGVSSAIERFRRNLTSLAKDRSTLVLIGESGVGKGFLAAHLHAAGPLNQVPPEILNFSILYERDQRVGLLGGEPPNLTTSRRNILEFETTVVLKHIDCANLFLQDKLAESLVTGTTFRYGSSQPRPLLARVILTLRHPLPIMRKKGTLSPNLLEVLDPLEKIHLPPLHQRREDVPLLISYFAKKIRDGLGQQSVVTIRGVLDDGSVDAGLMDVISNQRWEENTRDLIAFLRNLALLPFAQQLLEYEVLEVIKMVLMLEVGHEFSLPARLANIERRFIARAAQNLNNHKRNVAQLLGLSERAIGRKIGPLTILFFTLLQPDLSRQYEMVGFLQGLVHLLNRPFS